MCITPTWSSFWRDLVGECRCDECTYLEEVSYMIVAYLPYKNLASVVPAKIH